MVCDVKYIKQTQPWWTILSTMYYIDFDSKLYHGINRQRFNTMYQSYLREIYVNITVLHATIFNKDSIISIQTCTRNAPRMFILHVIKCLVLIQFSLVVYSYCFTWTFRLNRKQFQTWKDCNISYFLSIH